MFLPDPNASSQKLPTTAKIPFEKNVFPNSLGAQFW